MGEYHTLYVIVVAKESELPFLIILKMDDKHKLEF
jgi:hypothetical protein